MLSSEELDAIRQFDTCTISNAIEHFRVRLRNEGFTRPGLQCVTGSETRLLGYAATSRIRFSNFSITGAAYLERTDWWGGIDKLPLPRIAVIQDMDPGPGRGAAVGEVHAAILKAFRFSGLITKRGCERFAGGKTAWLSHVRAARFRVALLYASGRLR
jgi:hypothetical protein